MDGPGSANALTALYTSGLRAAGTEPWRVAPRMDLRSRLTVHTLKLLTAALLASVAVTGCSIDVDKRVDARDAGLPAYPGARLMRDGNGTEGARVNINSSWFGVHVVAAKYMTGDEPEAVLSFYRQALASYGTVTECRGNVDFKRRGPAICHADTSSKEVQLITGVKNDQRIVAVKPHGRDTEFAIVHVQTEGRNPDPDRAS